jgi:hypothetical protein
LDHLQDPLHARAGAKLAASARANHSRRSLPDQEVKSTRRPGNSAKPAEEI